METSNQSLKLGDKVVLTRDCKDYTTTIHPLHLYKGDTGTVAEYKGQLCFLSDRYQTKHIVRKDGQGKRYEVIDFCVLEPAESSNGKFPTWEEFKEQALAQWDKAHPAPVSEEEVIPLIKRPRPMMARPSDSNLYIVIDMPRDDESMFRINLGNSDETISMKIKCNDLNHIIKTLTDFNDQYKAYRDFLNNKKDAYNEQKPLLDTHQGKRGTFVSDLRKEWETNLKAYLESNHELFCPECGRYLENAYAPCGHCVKKSVKKWSGRFDTSSNERA